jgi:hypothetical protein
VTQRARDERGIRPQCSTRPDGHIDAFIDQIYSAVDLDHLQFALG